MTDGPGRSVSFTVLRFFPLLDSPGVKPEFYQGKIEWVGFQGNSQSPCKTCETGKPL